MIGFGGLWRSPYGGHLMHMTKVPWAHLLFPESVILQERKRFRPNEDPSCFEEIKGGLNRMRLAKFRSVMTQTKLEPTYFDTNRNDRAVGKALNVLSKLPGLEGYFTFSIHSIWEHP